MRSLEYLWAKNIEEHIYIMECLYNRVPIKPEWLSWEEIQDLKKRMNES